MKTCAIKTILIISMVFFGLLDPAMAHEDALPVAPKIVSRIDKSSLEAQAYLAHETAILNKDYTKAWSLECSVLRMNRWENSFEDFVKFYTERKSAPGEQERALTILSVKNISDKEVNLNVGSGQTFVVVNENGRWCFAGVLGEIRSGKK